MRISDWSSDVCSSDLPNLVAHEGEAYRDRLKALAHDLGVGNNIAFIDAFVEQGDLIDYLQAADLYVTPYPNPAQITRSEEHTSELQSLMRISYAVFCLTKKKPTSFV